MSGIIVGGKLINPGNWEKKLVQAFEEWAKQDINDAYWDDQFRDMGKWEYGRETVRKNKETVESPRDIYDLGKLYDSGRDSFNVTIGASAVEASWNWNATGGTKNYHYAHDVHEGEGTSYGFPRRWTDELADPLKFNESPPEMALRNRIRLKFLS